VSDKPKRRWYQFSLRMLLGTLTILCLGPGGWLAYERGQVRKEHESANALAGLGASIEYESESPPWLAAVLGGRRIAGIDVSVVNPDDAQSRASVSRIVEKMKSFRCLRSAKLKGVRLGDEEAANLSELASIESLDVAETDLTDAGVAELGRLRKLRKLDLHFTDVRDSGLLALRELNLSDTDITDAGLAHFEKFKQLELLNLVNTQVTDAGLRNLRHNNLITLNLWNTEVTDSGLPELGRMSRLKALNLMGTQVTAAGARKVRKMLPGATVYGK
jgi:hypothetical protein